MCCAALCLVGSGGWWVALHLIQQVDHLQLLEVVVVVQVGSEVQLLLVRRMLYWFAQAAATGNRGAGRRRGWEGVEGRGGGIIESASGYLHLLLIL